jgi:hypothetical protein
MLVLMKPLATIFGLTAAAMFVLSYQCKTRRGIILLNAGSRVLYVLQYILLGAYDGMVLDLSAFLVSMLAQRKDRGWLRSHPRITILAANLFLTAVGLMFYQNIFSLLAVIGVLLETGALWLSRERQIRLLSFFAAPFWLVYNLSCSAYGSVIGNLITMVSISLAIFRYDIRKTKS